MHRLLSLFASALLLSACQDRGSPPPPRQELHLSLYSDPASFDPRKVSLSKDLSLAKELYEGLFRLNPEGKLVPALAEEVLISEDGLSYTFKLRPSCWSNGEELTAYDFERSWRELLSPSFPSDSFNLLYPIKHAKAFRQGTSQALGIKALDSATLLVQLEQPTAYFLELLSFPLTFPVHPSHSEQEFIGNGPFCLLSWSPQKELILEKNPLYWDAASVKVDRICWAIIDDENSACYLFEKGQLDWIGPPLTRNILPEMVVSLKEKGIMGSYPVLGTLWIQFNTRKPALQQVAIRKALGTCICRQEIVSQILEGGQPYATSVLPPLIALCQLPHFKDGDLETALGLLTQAPAIEPLTLCYRSSTRTAKIAQYLADTWREKLGIEVKLAPLETHVYREKVRAGEFDLSLGEWIADFHDPISFLELFHENHVSGWTNAIYNALLEKAADEADPQERSALLKRAEEVLMDEMPISPLYHYVFEYAAPSLSHLVLSPLGGVDFKWVEKAY